MCGCMCARLSLHFYVGFLNCRWTKKLFFHHRDSGTTKLNANLMLTQSCLTSPLWGVLKDACCQCSSSLLQENTKKQSYGVHKADCSYFCFLFDLMFVCTDLSCFSYTVHQIYAVFRTFFSELLTNNNSSRCAKDHRACGLYHSAVTQSQLWIESFLSSVKSK